MADLKTLQGILALVDVVNFTPQANKLGEKFTAQYTAYFQEKIKTTVEKYRFQAVKFLGDAVLFFGTDPDSLLEIMLDLYERDKPEDKFGFMSRFRMVAHSGNPDPGQRKSMCPLCTKNTAGALLSGCLVRIQPRY